LKFQVNFHILTTDGPRGCALNRNTVVINRGGIVTASKFFSMETLFVRNFNGYFKYKNLKLQMNAAKFVPNDVLTILVDVNVFGKMEYVPEDETCDIPPYQGSISNWKNSARPNENLSFQNLIFWERTNQKSTRIWFSKCSIEDFAFITQLLQFDVRNSLKNTRID
jgi:hypothetical protein